MFLSRELLKQAIKQVLSRKYVILNKIMLTRNICLVKICLFLRGTVSPDCPSNVTVLKFQLKRQHLVVYKIWIFLISIRMVCVGFKSALTKDPEDLDHDTVMKVRHYFICTVHMNMK